MPLSVAEASRFEVPLAPLGPGTPLELSEGFRRGIGLPKGWVAIQSRSRPGETSFKNTLTGQTYKEFPKKAATMRRHRSLREFQASQPPPPEGEQPAPAEPPVELIDPLRKYGWLPYDDPYTVLGRTIDRPSWATLPRTDTEAGTLSRQQSGAM